MCLLKAAHYDKLSESSLPVAKMQCCNKTFNSSEISKLLQKKQKNISKCRAFK